jgi:5-methylcytosine-specific restriction endonuclease McrA|tara:strand:- start:311 stop:619 length:309 start_codon:yes stop_codon:yes gene_type:complete
VDHCIDGTVLVSRRHAKRQFRQSILEAWEHRCAYCGKPATTLDHVRPRSKGGQTDRANLISCCASCNSRKGSDDWVVWYRLQPFWTAEAEGTIWLWLHQDQC